MKFKVDPVPLSKTKRAWSVTIFHGFISGNVKFVNYLKILLSGFISLVTWSFTVTSGKIRFLNYQDIHIVTWYVTKFPTTFDYIFV